MAMLKNNNSLKNTAKSFAAKATTFPIDVLKSSEALVDNTMATGEKVQDLMEKALQNGVSILGKQQDLTLDAIETIVGQYRETNGRFKKLIGWNKRNIIIEIPFKKQTQKIISTAKEIVGRTDTLLPKVPTKKIANPKPTKKKVIKQVKVKTSPSPSKNKRAVNKNDFTVIEGIGPKIASILQKAGIQSFEQLAKTDVTNLQIILAKAGKQYQKYDPATWGQQANLAATGKWEVLAVWKKRIKGGKSSTASRIVIL